MGLFEEWHRAVMTSMRSRQFARSESKLTNGQVQRSRVYSTSISQLLRTEIDFQTADNSTPSGVSAWNCCLSELELPLEYFSARAAQKVKNELYKPSRSTYLLAFSAFAEAQFNSTSDIVRGGGVTPNLVW
jgi:hypothetical protein